MDTQCLPASDWLAQSRVTSSGRGREGSPASYLGKGLVMATTTMKVDDSAARRRHRALRQRTAVLQALGVALVALLLVSGCGAGKNAQTSQEVPAIPGVDADAGPIALRDLLIPFRKGGYPAGSNVPLVVRMFSTAELPVQLSQVAPGANGTMTVQAQRISLRQPGAAAGSDGPPTSLVVPAGGYLLLVPGSGPYLVAEHITAALPYTASVPVRFSFSTGDSVQIDVPMAPPTYPVTGGSQVGPSPPPDGILFDLRGRRVGFM